MNWLANISTRTKLWLGFGLMLGLLAGSVATALSGIQAIRKSFQITLALAELERGFNGQRVAMLTMLQLTNRTEQLAAQQEVEQITQDVSGQFKRLLELTGDNPRYKAEITTLLEKRDEFRNVRDTEVIPRVLAGKVEEARDLTLGPQRQRFYAIRETMKKLSTEAEQQAEQRARQSRTVLLIMGLLALGLGAVLVNLLNQMIADPLKAITALAEQIARGDVAVNIATSHRRDEVGVLMQTFGRMTQSLQTMAGVAGQIAAGDLRVQVRPQSEKDVLGKAFAAMVVNLQRLTADISEAVNVLGSAGSEIVASATQLSAAAMETATSVTETTTTVEEVKQTAQVASQKAKSVSESAQKSAQISQAGRKSTDETVESMKRIHQQMNSIADSMVRLSEQTQAISQIIASVDDLAAQSNLLAVNAAIEAAKAGEQGKGFAVVAQEVKSLAEQSKQATNQVRTILHDIQKATSAAVMATEQGSKAVETGVKQSAQAGDSIIALTSGVTEAAQAATQIAASSQQQLVGVEQVAAAMENIKQSSAQNVASAKQLETSARNLSELGQKLKELVGRYKA